MPLSLGQSSSKDITLFVTLLPQTVLFNKAVLVERRNSAVVPLIAIVEQE